MMALYIVIALYAAVMAAILASFGCVVAERKLDGRSLSGRSTCACGRNLKWSENIPIVRYVKVKGKTVCCNQKIPSFYVKTETYSFILGFFLTLPVLTFGYPALGNGVALILMFIQLAIFMFFVKRNLKLLKKLV